MRACVCVCVCVCVCLCDTLIINNDVTVIDSSVGLPFMSSFMESTKREPHSQRTGWEGMEWNHRITDRKELHGTL